MTKKTYHEYKANRSVFIFLLALFFIVSAFSQAWGIVTFIVLCGWGLYMSYKLHQDSTEEDYL